MSFDLSPYAGFRLALDLDTLELRTGDDITFKRTTRMAETLKSVLRSPDAVSPDAEMYHVFHLESSRGSVRNALERYNLTYGPVLLPPRRIDREFVKTHGHYHPSIPGATYGYPEVYTQLYGQLLLLLQKRDRSNPSTPADCALLVMDPGVTITVPPNYAHVLINPTDEVAVMAGLYSLGFEPDYTEVRQHRGLAYYILDDNGAIRIEPNQHYTAAPPLRRVEELSGTIFAPPEPGVPLWTSFVNDPSRYAFLAQPDAVREYLKPFSP